VPRREEDPAVEGGVDGGAEIAEKLYPQGYKQGLGASTPLATARIGSASAGLQAENEAARGLGQLHGEARWRSHPPRAAPVTPRG